MARDLNDLADEAALAVAEKVIADGQDGDDYPEEPVPYTLKRPVTFRLATGNSDKLEEVTITEVLIREPDGDDLIAMGKGKTDEEKGARLIAAMCEQPYLFARKLKGWDFAAIGLIVARFFPAEGSPLKS